MSKERVVTINEDGVLNVNSFTLLSPDGQVRLTLTANDSGAWVELKNEHAAQMVNICSFKIGSHGYSAVAVTRIPIQQGYDACMSLTGDGEAVIQARCADGSLNLISGTELSMLDQPKDTNDHAE